MVLLHREGFDCSASMVGRILPKLKERGVLREPMSNHLSARRRRWQRPYAVRKPKEYLAKKPGNIVELDTLDVRPLPSRSPKLNGHVERAQRTHTEEFYEVTDASFEIGKLNQAWGYLTPLEFLEQYQKKRREVMCH